MIAGVIIACIIAYFIVIFVPTLLIYRYLESKYIFGSNSFVGKRMSLYEEVGIKKISARQSIKRRSSWPLAYSNIIMTEKDQ